MSSMMYARRAADPLSINTNHSANGGVYAAASFQYAGDSALHTARKDSEAAPPRTRRRAASRADSQGPQRTNDQDPSSNMTGYTSTQQQQPPGMYVRALYDYDADDRTSLSFRQGDVIQVITQLESGWWDGIINNVRGWFPSNYCALISGPDDLGPQRLDSVDSGISETESELEEEQWDAYHKDNDRRLTVNAERMNEANDEHEEAAFWIPQATKDGRLYYYNTLTGVSTHELPLEAPTAAEEAGPRDRMNIVAPDQTRPPPELTRSGYETGDESASELEESYHRVPHQRRSYISDGASPTASMEDLNSSSYSLSRNQSTDFQRPERGASLAPPPFITTSTLQRPLNEGSNQTYHDTSSSPPLTWNRLVSNMERAVDAYRDAVNNADRSEYVRKAEDISDHLRLLLAAGSGTTDNHSGNPSIISQNKALYPYFRDMMSKFSKLVLSSHIAAADWPAPDSYSKCLQEAEGVLQGVRGYVEVARKQRGDELPRLWPGFVLGSANGGSWRSRDGPKPRTSASIRSFVEIDDVDFDSDNVRKLDAQALEELDEQRSRVTFSITRLDAQLISREKVITAPLHEEISSQICTEAAKVVEAYKAFMAGIEALDIKAIKTQETQVTTFLTQKQVLYDLVANLVIACQTVAGPLGDEWADTRGDPFEARLVNAKQVAKQMETALTHVTQTLHGILELAVTESPNKFAESQIASNNRARSGSRSMQSGSFMEDEDLSMSMRRMNKSKLERIFGEVPEPLRVSRESEETAAYLNLDHEGELAWDQKVTPPVLRGGTLPALVEQLTRHNGMDPNFNETFLLTYRSFTTAQELFELLVKRFSIQPPAAISVQDAQQWAQKKQTIVRLRVVNILKRWIDVFWLEPKDEASSDLLRRILIFATDHVASTNTPGHQQLKTSVEARLQGKQSGRQVLISTEGAPLPILPKNMRKLKFLDINETELARQLTINEFSLYKKILPLECLNKTWQKKVGPGDPEPAPNVKVLIANSNMLTNWVVEVIVEQTDVKRRAAIIKHFVNVADKCRQLNNFSTLMSIITALGSSCVHRLARTWGQINARTMNTLENLRNMMASGRNFSEYRETLHSANPPCIPFFGVYLTDLTFIEDGIPSVIKKTNLINFAKRSKTAEVIRDIQQYQNHPYQLTPVSELQIYIRDAMVKAPEVQDMYEKSLQIEPREREDEKIARLLSESGFL